MYNPNSKSIGSRITNDMLPRVEDRFSFLYIEYARIVQDEFSIAAYQKNRKVIIPLAMINVLLLGPGTSVSHTAIKNIADADCTAIWCGQDIKYIYSTSMVSSEYSKNLIIQAKCYADTQKHIDVVRRMYQIRYPDVNISKFSLQQMRGMEGKRVKQRYRELSEEYGVKWDGREYQQDDWDASSDINRFYQWETVSVWNLPSCDCDIWILSRYSVLYIMEPQGHLYMIWLIYIKKILVFPAAFRIASEHGTDEDMRIACREMFVNEKLM